MNELAYSTGENIPLSSVGHEISTLQPVGDIFCISDPSGANIYLDGVLQIQITSTTLTNIRTGNHTVTFTKAGYSPYTESITIKQNQIVKVAGVLSQIVNIIDSGIVICMTSNISSCPITPISCPISVSPLDYINFMTILSSTAPTTLTVIFTYISDSTINTANVPVTLAIGTNVVYAFPVNRQYSPNVIISLTSVALS